MLQRNLKKIVRRVFILFILVSLLYPAGCGLYETPEPHFTDVSSGAGIRDVSPTYDAIAADFNNDGWLDILVPNHGHPLSLYVNNRDGSFLRMPRQAGLGLGDMHGAAVLDYDNDGDQDIYFALGAQRGSGTKANRLHENMGNLKFRRLKAGTGFEDPRGRGRGVVVFDYDEDGFSDLFVVNFATPNRLFTRDREGRFCDRAGGAGLSDLPQCVCVPGDYDGDGDLDLFCTGVGRDTLLENDGEGQFVDVTIKAGILPQRSGQCPLWGDFDNDQDLDLYVTRGVGHRDEVAATDDGLAFYCNSDGEIKGLDFETGTEEIVCTFYTNGQRREDSVFIGESYEHPESQPFIPGGTGGQESQGEIDLGKGPGIYIWRNTKKECWQMRFFSPEDIRWGFSGIITMEDVPDTFSTLAFENEPIPTANTLYENLGNKTFRDITEQAGVGDSRSSQGGGWGDLDNDGDLDLYIVNGGYAILNEPNTLYLNHSDGTFSDISIRSGATAQVEGRGFGCLLADFNNDAFLDIFVTNGQGNPPFHGGPHKLFRNDGNRNHWLLIHLEGTASPRDAVGARVSVKSGDLVQTRENAGGNPYYSFSHMPLHFGLGSRKKIEWIRIRWPGGALQEFYDLSADQCLRIREGAEKPEAL